MAPTQFALSPTRETSTANPQGNLSWELVWSNVSRGAVYNLLTMTFTLPVHPYMSVGNSSLVGLDNFGGLAELSFQLFAGSTKYLLYAGRITVALTSIQAPAQYGAMVALPAIKPFYDLSSITALFTVGTLDYAPGSAILIGEVP